MAEGPPSAVPAVARPAPGRHDRAVATSVLRGPRVFDSPLEAARDLAAVTRRARVLAAVFALRRLDPPLRERVMVAVSQVNACRGCTSVHVRWAQQSGVTPGELDAIDLGELGFLDRRSQAAVAYATALAETRFRPVSPDLAAVTAEALTPAEVEAVEAIARMITFANLTVSTAEAVIGRLRGPGRLRRRPD